MGTSLDIITKTHKSLEYSNEIFSKRAGGQSDPVSLIRTPHKAFQRYSSSCQDVAYQQTLTNFQNT